MEDLIGYEERKPSTLRAIKSGYPRFVRHHRITDLIDALNDQEDDQEKEGFLFNKKSDCDFALNLLGLKDACVDEIDRLVRMQIPRDS